MTVFERVVIEDVSPIVDGGRRPVKAVVGEHLPVRATVWRDGHLPLTAAVRWTGPDRETVSVPMVQIDADLDLWEATVVATAPGGWTFEIEAWTDPGRTWREGLGAKAAAGHSSEQLANDLELGARLLERAATLAGSEPTRGARATLAVLRDPAVPLPEQLEAVDIDGVGTLLVHPDLREHVAASDPYPVCADPPRAAFGAWYQLFPRSTGGRDAAGRPVHGTFATAAADLPRVAAMGFDVVYLAPIHPIGRTGRKGRNNQPVAEPCDPGCPWAIGSADGGHDAICPELGDVAAFSAYVATARELGLEVALELALQCSPDHPWLVEHREWFGVRPDGSIACAENPPRIWTDVHPLDFDNDPDGLYAEIRRIVAYWIELGVSAFRVDNPHTKPVGFWDRLLSDLKRDHPHVVFLAEAFTRPAVQRGLSKHGFTQSYTYFMWRDEKDELVSFGRELVRDADVLRPNLFPSNHDVFPPVLHRQGPPMFAIRAALAATLSPSWGIYSGYEICENEPLTAGGHVPADPEKYELRPRDFVAARSAGRSIEDWIGLLNRIRRRRPALQQLRTLRFHPIDDPQLIAYSKRDPVTSDRVLVVVTLDPERPRRGVLGLTPRELGLDADAVQLVDEIGGDAVTWDGPLPVALDPRQAVAAIHRIVPSREARP